MDNFNQQEIIFKIYRDAPERKKEQNFWSSHYDITGLRIELEKLFNICELEKYKPINQDSIIVEIKSSNGVFEEIAKINKREDIDIALKSYYH